MMIQIYEYVKGRSLGLVLGCRQRSKSSGAKQAAGPSQLQRGCGAMD
jgi:hypothetical protein